MHANPMSSSLVAKLHSEDLLRELARERRAAEGRRGKAAVSSAAASRRSWLSSVIDRALDFAQRRGGECGEFGQAPTCVDARP